MARFTRKHRPSPLEGEARRGPWFRFTIYPRRRPVWHLRRDEHLTHCGQRCAANLGEEAAELPQDGAPCGRCLRGRQRAEQAIARHGEAQAHEVERMRRGTAYEQELARRQEQADYRQARAGRQSEG